MLPRAYKPTVWLLCDITDPVIVEPLSPNDILLLLLNTIEPQLLLVVPADTFGALGRFGPLTHKVLGPPTAVL